MLTHRYVTASYHGRFHSSTALVGIALILFQRFSAEPWSRRCALPNARDRKCETAMSLITGHEKFSSQARQVVAAHVVIHEIFCSAHGQARKRSRCGRTRVWLRHAIASKPLALPWILKRHYKISCWLGTPRQSEEVPSWEPSWGRLSWSR
jgi:hypothetical protein